jgi:hypothetical protein
MTEADFAALCIRAADMCRRDGPSSSQLQETLLAAEAQLDLEQQWRLREAVEEAAEEWSGEGITYPTAGEYFGSRLAPVVSVEEQDARRLDRFDAEMTRERRWMRIETAAVARWAQDDIHSQPYVISQAIALIDALDARRAAEEAKT